MKNLLEHFTKKKYNRYPVMQKEYIKLKTFYVKENKAVENNFWCVGFIGRQNMFRG